MVHKLLASAAGLLGAGALAATLALGAPAPAGAADPQAPAAIALGAEAQAPAAPALVAAARGPAAGLVQQGPGRPQRGQASDKVAVAALVRATAEATGLTSAEVLEAVKGGQSLAQVAAANGSGGDAVVQAVAAKAEERLDRQVQAGRISQARADELLQRLTDKATQLVNDATLGAKIDERLDQARSRAAMPALVKAASEATGLPVGDLTGRMRDGESLRQIVESAGGDPEAVLDAATDAFRAAAEAALDATR